MKIALIGQKGIPAKEGGVERHVEDLATRLSDEGDTVFVYARKSYTGTNKREYNYKGVRIVNLISIPTKHLDAISHTFFACFHLWLRRVDVIHFHSIGPSSLIWLVKLLKPSTPVVATFHSQCYFHRKWGKIARFTLKAGEWMCCRWADRVIAVSENLKRYAKSTYQREVDHIPNGISSPKPYREAAEIKKWGLEKGNYILSISRLVRHKGIHHLIHAYKRSSLDKKLVVAGDSAKTDDYVKELRQLAGDDPNIIFTGNQFGVTLEELMSNAFMFVHPSESEGLSIALLEAMAYELPIIASSIPENKEAIKDTGVVFENGRSDDLVRKMEQFASDPDRMRAKAESAKMRAEEKYNWDNIVQHTRNIYNQVISEQVSIKVKFIKSRKKVEVK